LQPLVETKIVHLQDKQLVFFNIRPMQNRVTCRLIFNTSGRPGRPMSPRQLVMQDG